MDNSINETATAPTAPVETTQTTATAPVAPTETTAPVVSEPVKTVAAEPTTAATVADTPAAAEPVDEYDWVPPKFKLDGKPDFQKLATSYTALEKKISTKAGVAPESLDDYVYEPKEIALDPEDHKSFKEFAKSISLSPAQYSKVLEKYEESFSRTAETPAKARDYLQKQWGDDFNRNTELAIKAFEAYAPSHIPIEAIGNNPYVIDLLARFGAELGEDTVPTKRATTVRMTREENMALIAERNKLPMGSKERDELDKQISTWYEKNIK